MPLLQSSFFSFPFRYSSVSLGRKHFQNSIWYSQPLCTCINLKWILGGQKNINIHPIPQFELGDIHSCEMLPNGTGMLWMLFRHSSRLFQISNVVILLSRFRTCLHSRRFSIHNSPFVSSRLQYHCIHTFIANKHSFYKLFLLLCWWRSFCGIY